MKRESERWIERERRRVSTTITNRAYRGMTTRRRSAEVESIDSPARCNKDEGTVTMAWCGRVSGSCRLQVVCLLGNQPLRTVPTEGLSPTMQPMVPLRPVLPGTDAFISRSLARTRSQSRCSFMRVESKARTPENARYLPPAASESQQRRLKLNETVCEKERNRERGRKR